MSAADDTRTEIAAVLAGHHCRMHKKGPIECWSTLDDQECGLRFTTGGQYRAHVAEVLAEYVASKRAEAARAAVRAIAGELRESGAYSEHRMADWVELRVERVADRIAP